MAMVGNNSSESLLPGLEAFDEEFGREPTDFLHNERLRKWRFSRFIWAVLGAVLITALVWLWVRADWGLLNEVQAFLPFREAPSATHPPKSSIGSFVRSRRSNRKSRT